MRKKIGVMIREKRNGQHLTQEDLAEKVSLSIGLIERGETMPSVENLDAIIQELGIDARPFF